jgi:hypothetical protein
MKTESNTLSLAGLLRKAQLPNSARSRAILQRLKICPVGNAGGAKVYTMKQLTKLTEALQREQQSVAGIQELLNAASRDAVANKLS